MYSVALTKVIEEMGLENCTPDVNINEIMIKQSDVNRPALQLAGFLDYFDSSRIQIIGNVENTYLAQFSEEEVLDKMRNILACKVPCIVFCRNLDISKSLLDLATEYGVPLLRSSKTTSAFTAEVIRWLNVELAPRISIHGVLVDVYGEGLLIMGESGIGKSEAALELIKRGHRLVSDDVVEIKKVSDATLLGTAPDITRHFIELRGIGKNVL